MVGMYRDGGAVEFDGVSSFGWIAHTPEYDFHDAMTLQMVVHPGVLPAGSARTQVLANKNGSWRLELTPDMMPRWGVQLVPANGKGPGTWVSAAGTQTL